VGLGSVSAKTIIQNGISSTGVGGLVENSIRANSPQVAVSLLYFAYNGLVTSMCLASEWSNFAKQRKGLRVSRNRVGSQRETYFLQVPYRYALPLVLSAAILHWLISQSIFLIDVEEYERRPGSYQAPTVRGNLSFIACGWSPLGTICVIAVALLMFIFLVVTGKQRLRSGMPVAGSCSAAISAACHSIPYEPQAWEQALRWGSTPSGDGVVGHCSFSSGEVTYPRDGEQYS
jgi:hypothetical protein